jgi:SAM-dependent methyltransferase
VGVALRAGAPRAGNATENVGAATRRVGYLPQPSSTNRQRYSFSMSSARPKKALKRAEINELRRRLRRWHGRFPGRILAAMEAQQLDNVLSTLFGYHALQVGCLTGENLLNASRIPHRVVMDPDRGDELALGLAAYPDSLPIRSDSIDLVLLPHTLEFERVPHQILREVDRVLIAEGHVVILGFNPWSLWGLMSFLSRWRKRTAPPWSARFIGLTRIKDWLALLGFEVVVVRPFFFRPPLAHEGLMRRVQWLEKLGARLWPGLGSVYLLVAKKRVTTLTPIRSRWRPRRSLIGKLAEPSP